MVKSSTIQSLYIIYNSTVYLLIGQNLRSKGVWRNKETEVKVNFESNFVPNKNERVYKIHFLLQGCAAQPGLLGGAGKTAGCWNGEAARLDNLQKYHMRHFPIDSHFHVFGSIKKDSRGVLFHFPIPIQSSDYWRTAKVQQLNIHRMNMAPNLHALRAQRRRFCIQHFLTTFLIYSKY